MTSAPPPRTPGAAMLAAEKAAIDQAASDDRRLLWAMGLASLVAVGTIVADVWFVVHALLAVR